MTNIVIDDKAHVASLDIHAQNTFTPVCPEELPVPDGHLIVAQLNGQAQFAGKRVGTKEAHNKKAIWIANSRKVQFAPVIGENVDVRWVPHAIVGTKGFELIKGLPKIAEYDYFVWQGIELDMHPYGVCYHDFAEKLSTGLIEYLHSNQIKTVIAGGLSTDYCVKTSVLQLIDAGFKVIVNLAACRGLEKMSSEAAKKQMEVAGAILIDSYKDLTLKT